MATNVAKGDKVKMFDDEDETWHWGTVDHTDDSGSYLFVRCDDGIMAECQAGDLRWMGDHYEEQRA